MAQLDVGLTSPVPSVLQAPALVPAADEFPVQQIFASEQQQQQQHAASQHIPALVPVNTASVQPAGPPVPYQWFDVQDRLFPTVADIPLPVDTPSILDLAARANRLLAERLDNSTFTMPSMPEIVYTMMGDPDVDRGALGSSPVRSSGTKIGHSLSGQDAPHQQEQQQLQGVRLEAIQEASASTGEDLNESQTHIGGTGLVSSSESSEAQTQQEGAISRMGAASNPLPKLELSVSRKHRLTQLGFADLLSQDKKQTNDASMTLRQGFAMVRRYL